MSELTTMEVLDELYIERRNQDEKWGEQNHPSFKSQRDTRYYEEMRDTTRIACQTAADAGMVTWEHILDEEIAETYAETDPAKIRAELVQSAAVIVAWIECIDRAEARS